MSDDKKIEGAGAQTGAGEPNPPVEKTPEAGTPSAQKAKKEAAPVPQLVKATQRGYYGKLRDEEETFEIADVVNDFSHTWMVAVDEEGKPLKKQPPERVKPKPAQA
jgi:hypothetical protein